MTDPTLLQRLKEGTSPDDALRARVKMRLQQRIGPASLTRLVESVRPGEQFKAGVRSRLLHSIRSSAGAVLPELAKGLHLPSVRALALRERILGRLRIPHVSWFSVGLKWTAAFAMFLLLIR